MIKHVVMWRFKDLAGGRTKPENLELARERLLALQSSIPEVRSLEIGLDVVHSAQSYDLVLVAEFDSLVALDAYRDHPEHQAVVRYLRTVHQGRVVVDYEVGA